MKCVNRDESNSYLISCRLSLKVMVLQILMLVVSHAVSISMV